MSIFATDTAVKQIKKALIQRGKGIGIRLGVKTSGCCGLSYILEFVDLINENDHIYKINGIQIVVDKANIVYLDGIELDFIKDGLNEGFKFNNPNANSECGCGESFNV